MPLFWLSQRFQGKGKWGEMGRRDYNLIYRVIGGYGWDRAYGEPCFQRGPPGVGSRKPRKEDDVWRKNMKRRKRGK